MSYWKRATIWLTRHTVYIVKTQKKWYGPIQSRQAGIYDCRSSWMQGGAQTASLIHQLAEVYGLQSYNISVLVGDAALVWKPLRVPSKKRAEACQMAVWDEALGDGSRMYAFDLQTDGREQSDGTYEWLLGAYPYDLVMSMLDAFESHDCLVERIDVVPAAAGRLCPSGNGTLYLYVRHDEIHEIGLKQGIPFAYRMASQLPADAVQWLQQEGLAPEDTLLWRDTPASCWMTAPVCKDAQKQQHQWDIPGPAILLTTL